MLPSMLRTYFHIWRFHFLSAFEYRTSFFSFFLAMAFADVITFFVFSQFFIRFGSIGGMDYHSYLYLAMISELAPAIMVFVF